MPLVGGCGVRLSELGEGGIQSCKEKMLVHNRQINDNQQGIFMCPNKNQHCYIIFISQNLLIRSFVPKCYVKEFISKSLIENSRLTPLWALIAGLHQGKSEKREKCSCCPELRCQVLRGHVGAKVQEMIRRASISIDLVIINKRFNMDQQADKFAFMVDVSGSTGGSENYWNTVQEIFNLHANETDLYYEWDSGINKVDKKEMEFQIESRQGKGGTSPEVVAREIVDKKLKKVILITDGQVSDHNVKECDKILQAYQFTRTICYIIASSSYGHLNMSVTCPFTRKCENEVYEKYDGKPLKKLVQYTPEDYKILDTLDDITLENFEANYDKIQGLIIALNMGKEGNIPLKNQLVVMKNRLVKELSKKKGGEFDINVQIRTHLQKGNLEGAFEIIDKLSKAYFADSMTMDLEKKISHLISLCGDLRGKYDIGQIKSNKMAHAQDAKEGTIDQSVEAHDISKNLIECPIIMDEDIPQILVDECEPILVGVEKTIVDDIAACPLRLLNYPDVKAKLKARLSNFMGVKYADKFLKNPFTQRKLLGAIPLGCHPSHIKVGNYTIARMFSDGKILGNMNLFYAAIWYIIKEKEIEYLKDIEKNATEHLIHRLKNSKTTASLCGLSQFVTTEMSTDLAVWYCANSGYLNQPTNRDTFRYHLYNIGPMIEMVKVLGYPIHKGVHRHLARTKSLFSVLAAFKKLTLPQQRSFKEAVRCLHQNGIQVNPKNIGKDFKKNEIIVNFVPIDGEAAKQKIERIVSVLPKVMRELPIDEIVHITSLIDSQKLAADIQIDFDFKCSQLPKSQINWGYGLKEAKEFPDQEFKLCPKTFRLVSVHGNEKWESEAEKRYQVPAKKLFKGRKYFQAFLRKYKRVPSKDELILFFYNRYVVKKKSSTLPYLTEQWAQRLVKEYSTVMEENKISVAQALELLDRSMPIDKRQVLEKS